MDYKRSREDTQKRRKRHVQINIQLKQQVNIFQTRVQLPPAPPNHDPDTSGEVQKARTAQALRAFLCLSLSENIRLNPVIIGIRLGIR